MHRCKNCGSVISGIYCAHCGQKARVERISFFYLSQEILHFFTHIQHGFLFTTLKMLTAPGRTAINFIEGKRRNYQSPVSYFLIWTTIYIVFLYWLEKIYGQNSVIDYKEYFGPTDTTRFAVGHLSMVLAIIIPFQALYLYLLITKGKYNYFETMVATVYSLGTVIMLQFVFALFAFFIHLIIGSTAYLSISDVLKVFYLAWFITDISRWFTLKYKSLRAAAFLALAFGTFTLWRLYGFAWAIHFFTGD